MHKNDNTLNKKYNTHKRFAGKTIAVTITMLLVFTAFTAASLQDPEYLSSLERKGRSIVWDVTILSNNAGGQNDYVVFGEATDANDGPPVDIYDVLKPPAPQTPYIRTLLNDNLPYPYDALTMDYRSYPDTAKIWNLTIHWMPSSGASPTTITVSWNTAEFVGCEYTSVTLSTESGTPLQNMLVNSTYIFSCPAYVPQNFKIICVASGNLPPIFGTPTPANGSTSNPLSLPWSIPINDPEGNLISWTIQCSNGQTNSGTNAANGTRSLALSGLAYSTM
ncbi:MAG: hypothetical protein NTX92_08100, partial [Euryarchaeota archaeon]|nr:hypothetical protein [Euryarchaeota archaeon]